MAGMREAIDTATTAGNTDPNPKGTPPDQRQDVVWDTENAHARQALHQADKAHNPPRVIDRMFNTSSRIGHNKFAVYVEEGTAKAVMTGSTNWTANGLCAQSNNVILIENDALAGDYWQYWQALRDDPQPAPVPYVPAPVVDNKEIQGSRPNSAKQGRTLRDADAQSPATRDLANGGTATLWRSPNTQKVSVPKTDPPPPPDLAEVNALMNNAREAVFFATFLPGESGKNNIIGTAVDLAQKPGGPLVLGAVSDPRALPSPPTGKIPAPSPIRTERPTSCHPRRSGGRPGNKAAS